MDWTDVETFSRPPSRGTRDCADPEASWGHRSGGGPGQDSELFFGYYASAATMMRDEHGPPVPELARRMTACSCRHDPARALVPVLTAMPGEGIPLGDILSDSGYAHRDAGAWAIPVRGAGAQLVQDLHPADRGPRGTHHGAIIGNGNLYCPATPHPARTRTPGPRRHPGPGRRPRPADRRDRPVQTRPHHHRRPRRLPPGDVPRGHEQDPLPAPARLHDPGPRPARDPRPARAPARLLTQQTITVPPEVAAKTRQNTTTPRRRTGDPTPGAPAPSGPSPPPRTPPPTTSPAAGPGSWA